MRRAVQWCGGLQTGLSVVAPMLRAVTTRAGSDPCPVCGARAAVPLVLGLPSPAVLRAAERGEVVLGGCVVDGLPGAPWPDLTCTSCGARWVSHEAVVEADEWVPAE